MWPFEFCKHVRDRAGVMESIAGVSGRSALDHFEFTDVIFGMRVPHSYCILILVVSKMYKYMRSLSLTLNLLLDYV